MKQHAVLKDLPEMKRNIIGIINRDYWEVAPKAYELKSDQQEHKTAVPEVSKRWDFWKTLPLPEISYELGKARISTSGEQGKRRLIQFLAQFEKCHSSEAMLVLIQVQRKQFSNTNFAWALAAAIPYCAKIVIAEESGSTDEASAKLLEVLKSAQRDLEYRECELIAASTPMPY